MAFWDKMLFIDLFRVVVQIVMVREATALLHHILRFVDFFLFEYLGRLMHRFPFGYIIDRGPVLLHYSYSPRVIVSEISEGPDSHSPTDL